MKKFLQFAGIISLALAAVAFVLMMATPAVLVKITSSSTVQFAGTMAIFGGKPDTAQALVILATEVKPAVMALLAWIFILIAMIILLLGVVLPLLKVKALEKFAGLLNLIAVALLVVGGVFMFIVLPSFYGAQDIKDVPDAASIGAGWVIGGIVAMIAGVIALLPMAADFMGKKKGKKR